MLVRAPVAIRAVALEICLAGWPIRVQAKSVFASEELAELESILWLLSFCGLLFGRARRYWCNDLGHISALLDYTPKIRIVLRLVAGALDCTIRISVAYRELWLSRSGCYIWRDDAQSSVKLKA